jgi:protocatechuate 3,4-dioxygenase beta subunit
MRQCCVRALLAVLVCALASSPAFAQGGVTSSITGIVVDQDGGVVPGATVVATNEATGGSNTVTSSANGTFIIPSILPGSYTVTVTLK